ncbi:hypothetical protein HAX54_004269, partial [Datura stramonium]|nr:hypothetical protein [Datura stramonium]
MGTTTIGYSRSGQLQGHCLNPASYRHFADRDRLADESPMETSLPSVLLTIG